MKISILLLLIAFLFTNGCIHNNESGDDGDTSKVTKEKKGYFDKTGEFKEQNIAKAGENIQQLVEEGDKVSFQVGKPMTLIIQDINTDYYCLEYKFNSSTQLGTIEVKRKEEYPTVYIKEKCEIVKINSTNIPNVVYKGEIDPKEQIITTPIYSDECHLIGYEVRYGSLERGCKDSFGTLRQLKKCQGDVGKEPRSKTRNSVEEIMKLFTGY